MLCFPMLISSLPRANPLLPEHKIGIFVRFLPSKPSISGFSSTKSGFLCAFGVWNPCFRAFRAQNRGFCVRKGNFSRVLPPPEHKKPDFVSKQPKISEKTPILTQKPRFCARNARKQGLRRSKKHKNHDFVLEM